MASISDPNKLIDPTQAQQAQGQAQQTSPQPQLSGTGGDVVGGGASGGSQGTASQPGSGGTSGGWTNLQSYIQANQGDTGSSKMLQDKVGSQFDQEKNNFDQQASQLKDQGQKAVDSQKQAESSASQWLGQAGKDYQYGGDQQAMGSAAQPQQNQAYQDDISKLQNAKDAKYEGPNSFAYGMSGDTQKYGQNLQNNDGFNQFMGDMYQQKAGGQLSDGQKNLQSQLDVNNQALTDTRQNLLKQYSGLGDYIGQGTKDTNNALYNDSQDFAASQGHLKDYLNGQNNDLQSAIAKEQANAKYQFQNDENTVGDGNGQTYSWFNNLASASGNNPSFGNTMMDPNTTDGALGPSFANANNWYYNQEQKYQDTADPEKRQWNAIQDILGNSSATRQKKGFDVRGS